jgi:sulfide:quinone oxidoreductase
MDIKKLSPDFSVAPQMSPADIVTAASKGFKSIICNRPDGEGDNQPDAALVEIAAREAGLDFAFVPVTSNGITAADAVLMAAKLKELPKPILAYCRSGARSGKIWEITKSLAVAPPSSKTFDVVIVGGGSAGIATASSLLKRNRRLSIAVIEPSEDHYYQPGWTMVGAGVFSAEFTKRAEKSVMPKAAHWIKKAA